MGICRRGYEQATGKTVSDKTIWKISAEGRGGTVHIDALRLSPLRWIGSGHYEARTDPARSTLVLLHVAFLRTAYFRHWVKDAFAT